MAWPVNFGRCIMFFQAPEGDGFSEEYLYNTSDPAALNAAMSVMLTARLTMLPADYSISYLRISDPHSPRTLIPYEGAQPVPAVGTFAGGVDFQRCEVGALVKMFAVDGRFCSRIFRGVADTAINTDGTFDTGNAWYTALTDFLDLILAGPTCGLINIVARTGYPAYTYSDYASYQVRRSSTRDTGRPFGLRRGRASA